MECRSALQRELAPAASALAHELMAAQQESFCLDEEQIRSYARGTADEAEREIVESHLSNCARCREDVVSLRSFHQEMQGYDWAAFSTASSIAAMPVTYANLKDRLEMSEESVSLGVLVGGNFNHDGTALFEALGVLFIVQAHTLPFGVSQQALLMVMAAFASVCAPGIPEAGLVTMVLIFQALGLPEGIKYIALLMPFDPLLDRCRTAVNVMGHITVACLLDGKPAPEPGYPGTARSQKEASPGKL